MEVSLAQLWLPILIATVCVFFTSSIIWMLLPYHKPDIKFIPNETEFDEAMAKLNIAPGHYMYPNCQDAKDMKSEAFKARWKSGPWGTINVMGQQPNFAINLLKTFIAYGLITTMVAYIAGMSVGPGAEYMHVFRVVATAGVLGHCMGGLANAFFMGTPTRFIFTSFIDGVIFALITAGVIASMWPDGMLMLIVE
jgi:hypothetical protein